MNQLLTTSNISFVYENEDSDANIILNDISLTIKEGEFISILGHNGCGKSTLSKHFNAILLPSKGEVHVCSVNTKEEKKIFLIRQNVGMVFQNPDNQIVATIVEEDVAFSLENLGVEPLDIRARVDKALKAVDMYEYRNHSVYQLSGGQKQRIAIAGVLAMNPKCIILDEPTAMLDPRGRAEVIDIIKHLNVKFNTTILLITHYMDEAVLAKRTIVMHEGKIIFDAEPREIFSNFEFLKSIGLGVPQSVELLLELKKNNINVPSNVLTEEECVEVLFDILK